MKNTKKLSKAKSASKTPPTTWNLKRLYKSVKDPQIEKDIKALERAIKSFVSKYKGKAFAKSSSTLLEALKDYEKLLEKITAPKPLIYFYLLQSIDSDNEDVQAGLNLLSNRVSKISNQVIFFELALGGLKKNEQPRFLKDDSLSHFHYFLKRVFESAKHDLSEAEEKILSLKSLTSSQMWEDGVQKALQKKEVVFRDKKIPISDVVFRMYSLQSRKERKSLHNQTLEKLLELEDFAESEINALYTDKKISDELREFEKPSSSPIFGWHNTDKEVQTLIDVIVDNWSVSKKFFALKSRLLNLSSLRPYDKKVSIGEIKQEFSFPAAVEILDKVFHDIDPKYGRIFKDMVRLGNIDVFPRRGKKGGAFQASFTNLPTVILLNHTDDFTSLSTLAHEMGHAIHSERSKVQSVLYEHYPTSAAEIASKFFETIVFEEMRKDLSAKENVIALHNQVFDCTKDVFMVSADFLMENELHKRIREKGFVSASEIAELHNSFMQKYEGQAVKREKIDGFTFIQIPHMRYFYYSYPYAYGLLVAKAMVRKYRKDPSYIEKIDQFLSAGGSDTPHNTLKKIGIDTYDPELWREGIEEIKRDMNELERLAKREGMLR